MLAPSTDTVSTVRDNFFVLTGASGAGKSSIIAALERRGFRCVNEMGRQVVRDELRAGSNGTPWPKIYVTDAERRHSFEEGVAHHRAELAAYIACGYAPLEVPRAPIEDRVAFILQNVSRQHPT